MEIRGPALKARLLDHGLKTDDSGKRVLFPREVVEKALADAPGTFTLFDRDGNPYTEIGGDNVHYTPGSSGLKILDHRTGETRLTDSTDFIEYARLADGLEHVNYLATAFSTNNSQASIGLPLIFTEQVPHCPCSQDEFQARVASNSLLILRNRSVNRRILPVSN